MDTLLNNDELKLTRVFAALGDPTRFEILNMLMKYPNVCVSNIADEMGLSVSAVSQQCKLLELSGLLTRVRKGQKICYEVKQDDPEIRKVINMIKE